MPPSLALEAPDGQTIHYLGPNASEGIKPAIIYFALSADMTLNHDPFNQPAKQWAEQGIRVFSWDLPFHEKGADPHEAMSRWAVEFAQNPTFLSDFMQTCQNNLQFLRDENLIDVAHLGIAGLSRGGFIATHFAAQQPLIKWIVGFAPLTKPEPAAEFHAQLSPYQKIELTQLTDQLTHTHVRFYIGNRDIRVQTESCFAFIKSLADAAFLKGIRSPASELIIYPSIGHKGHGTPPEIFKDGATWLQNQLLNRAFL